MAVWLIILLVMIGIVIAGIFGYLTSRIMETKGYIGFGGFVLGFFFGPIALFYAHALADRRERLEIKLAENYKKIVYIDIENPPVIDNSADFPKVEKKKEEHPNEKA